MAVPQQASRNGHLSAGPRALADPASWVDRHGDALFRYALLRLSDRGLAEDMVQETFLAALGARRQFSGKSSERSWLVGILKHKIIDHLRRQDRERPLSELDVGCDGAESFFDHHGKWRIKPRTWDGEPSALLEQKEFWVALQGCLAKLPPRLALAFSLRELDGFSADEVREMLQVSASNLWVLLHRGRLRLWRCLDLNWFRTTGKRT
jgi:RNA polymerase sigma-70 factor, ECF subfamily